MSVVVSLTTHDPLRHPLTPPLVYKSVAGELAPPTRIRRALDLERQQGSTPGARDPLSHVAKRQTFAVAYMSSARTDRTVRK